jgi:uncharacterized membrane protein
MTWLIIAILIALVVAGAFFQSDRPLWQIFSLALLAAWGGSLILISALGHGITLVSQSLILDTFIISLLSCILFAFFRKK